jgi:enoyl-CoA hydratase/carnithine racemase
MSAEPSIIRGGTAEVPILTFNRPHALNALDQEMRDRLRSEIASFGRDNAVRALIITGAGGAFCAGEDVRGMEDLSVGGTRRFRAISRSVHDAFDEIEALEVPVVAAIDGVAAGGGFELALSCDFRIASDDARLIMPEGRVGLIPGSGGCSRLIKYVGLGVAKEIVMLGDPLSAPRALELGLVNEVVPKGSVVDAALALVERLSRRAPLALGMAKAILNTCSEVDAESGRRLERLGQSVLKMTDDHHEGYAAFIEKRTPSWSAR